MKAALALVLMSQVAMARERVLGPSVLEIRDDVPFVSRVEEAAITLPSGDHAMAPAGMYMNETAALSVARWAEGLEAENKSLRAALDAGGSPTGVPLLLVAVLVAVAFGGGAVVAIVAK